MAQTRMSRSPNEAARRPLLQPRNGAFILQEGLPCNEVPMRGNILYRTVAPTFLLPLVPIPTSAHDGPNLLRGHPVRTREEWGRAACNVATWPRPLVPRLWSKGSKVSRSEKKKSIRLESRQKSSIFAHCYNKCNKIHQSWLTQSTSSSQVVSFLHWEKASSHPQ